MSKLLHELFGYFHVCSKHDPKIYFGKNIMLESMYKSCRYLMSYTLILSAESCYNGFQKFQRYLFKETKTFAYFIHFFGLIHTIQQEDE